MKDIKRTNVQIATVKTPNALMAFPCNTSYRFLPFVKVFFPNRLISRISPRIDTGLKYRLMDILACPMCRNFPLSLKIFHVDKRYLVKGTIKCEIYCSYHGDYINNLTVTKCNDCYTYEISDGLLFCDKCERWYPIIDDIPIMLPDGLRDKKREAMFLEKWREKLPKEIIEREKEGQERNEKRS